MTERRRDAITRFWNFAAPAYDQRCLQRFLYRPAQDEVIAALRDPAPRRVADIACGTGILAARIAADLHPDEVYGVDMSDGMLAAARRRSSAVSWQRGPAERLPFADGFLDAIVTTSAFHFFDQPAALAEFHRVLASGGLVAVATIRPSRARMRALFEGAGFTIEDQHHIRRPVWTRGLSDLITIGVKP